MSQNNKTATVIDVARAVNCSPHVVRVLADRGLIEMKRDYNNWRRFPNLGKSIQEMQNLLYSEPEKPDLEAQRCNENIEPLRRVTCE